MFSGIIQALGRIEQLDRGARDTRLRVGCETALPHPIAVGDSIAVNGCCLTAQRRDERGFEADVSAETLACTTLGELAPGARVNLEEALRAATAIGGHLVSGHVDGIGSLEERRDDGRSVRMRFRIPAPLARYVARKGSVGIDGVSLTVNEVDGERFTVNLVPHTLTATTLGSLAAGNVVNIEVDLVARYIERLMSAVETPQ